MGTPLSTRRAFIGGAVTVPAAMLATVAACSAPTPANAASSDLLALIAAADADMAASDSHYQSVYQPAQTRLNAAIDAVPHVTIAGGENVLGGVIVRTTANPGSVASNNTVVQLAREGRTFDGPTIAASRAFRAAHLRRERVIARIRKEYGLSGVNNESDALNEAAMLSEDAVGNYLARSPADLARKLAFMIERGMGTNSNWLPELLADARALANVEG